METDLKEIKQEQEKRKGSIRYFGCGDGKLWTPERKAELRKRMPKKLNATGEWFFSEAGNRDYLVVLDEKAVYGE